MIYIYIYIYIINMNIFILFRNNQIVYFIIGDFVHIVLQLISIILRFYVHQKKLSFAD